MKIPLEIDERVETPEGNRPVLEIRINLLGTLSFPRIGIRAIKFIVDTGSPRTFIGPTDAISRPNESYEITKYLGNGFFKGIRL